MSSKKGKKKNPRSSGAPKPLVRLSQCMIVKNEEKNIERALGWAKDIAYEQIVVDTGSTDKTVELAEKMGAKVYHFEWIDDFSAAKNYAIEKAKGNWIAFLDADEYFSDEDAKKLMILLKQIQSDPVLRKKYPTFGCPWVQLDDNNRAFSVLEQNRVFQNRPDVRYKGRIHEDLTITGEIPFASEISIMHTGYTKEAYATTGKAVRNIDLLRKERESRPDNPNLKVYLADSLVVKPTTDEKLAEAEQLYREALEDRHNAHSQLVRNAYSELILKYIEDGEKLDEAEKYSIQACEDFPQDIDFTFYRGVVHSRKGKSKEAFETLLECEKLLMDTSMVPMSRIVLPKPSMLFYELALAAQGLGDKESIIKYITLVLRENGYQEDILPQYISELRMSGATDEEMLGLLSKLFDYNSIKDKVFLAKCAKMGGASSLSQLYLGMITDEEREWMSGGGKESK